MASRRQEFKALGKFITQLRPIGKVYTFTVRGAGGRDLTIGFAGQENFGGMVSLPPVQVACSEANFFEMMTLFDKNKISFNDVVRLKGILKNQVEGRK